MAADNKARVFRAASHLTTMLIWPRLGARRSQGTRWTSEARICAKLCQIKCKDGPQPREQTKWVHACHCCSLWTTKTQDPFQLYSSDFQLVLLIISQMCHAWLTILCWIIYECPSLFLAGHTDHRDFVKSTILLFGVLFLQICLMQPIVMLTPSNAFSKHIYKDKNIYF